MLHWCKMDKLHKIMKFHGENPSAFDKAMKYGDKEHGITALMFACMCGREEIVIFLVDHGADVNALKQDGERVRC